VGPERTLTDGPWIGRATRRQTYRRPRTPLRRKSVGVLVEQRYLSHAQPAGMVAALRARGHDVFTIDPEGIAAAAATTTGSTTSTWSWAGGAASHCSAC
jgi:hypothetical protein